MHPESRNPYPPLPPCARLPPRRSRRDPRGVPQEKVSGVPTLLLFVDAKAVAQSVGLISQAMLTEFLETVIKNAKP